MGLFCTGGVTHFLPRTVGLARAKELIMTGEFFDGREAARLGLVNRAVPGDQVLPVAEALARTIMAKAPIPIAMAKSALESGAQSDLTTAMALETASTVACFLTEDAQGGRAGVRGEAAAPVPRALKVAERAAAHASSPSDSQVGGRGQARALWVWLTRSLRFIG